MRIRLAALFEKRINRLEELLEFDKQNAVQASYFVGVANGLSLSYSTKQAESIINYLQDKDVDLGIGDRVIIEGLLPWKENFKRLSKDHLLRVISSISLISLIGVEI